MIERSHDQITKDDAIAILIREYKGYSWQKTWLEEKLTEVEQRQDRDETTLLLWEALVALLSVAERNRNHPLKVEPKKFQREKALRKKAVRQRSGVWRA